MTETSISPSDWLAACLVTESNEPHEWHAITWTVRNRMLSGRYPKTVRDVVLQPWQFSHFNDFRRRIGRMKEGEVTERDVYRAVVSGTGDAKRVRALPVDLLEMAKGAAQDFLAEPVWRRPFGAAVCHYWSPISMRPKGSNPSWAPQAKRLFTPSGVDPERFIYAEGVP